MHKIKIRCAYAAAFSALGLPAIVIAVPPPGARTAQGLPVIQEESTAGYHGRTPGAVGVQSIGIDSLGVSLLSHIPIGDFPGNSTTSNDCWGYVSPSGREYALIGNFRGVGFVEVTNPTNPTIVGEVEHNGSTWSDMAVFDEYAYVVNENDGGLQVIDLRLLDQGIVSEAPANPNHFSSAHNLYLNTESRFVYPCGTSPVSGFIAYDLSNPASPQTDPSWIWNQKYVHDLYVTSYDDCPYAGRSGACEIAFAFCGGAGLYVIDVTDKSNMTTLASRNYPTLAYCHQGYATEDRRFLFIDDEADETRFGLDSTTYVFNIEDVGNPVYLDSFTNGIRSIDHNVYVRGDYMFAANYTSGLRIFDVSDPVNGVEVGFFDTSSSTFLGFGGAWSNYPFLPSGIVLVSDWQNGLFVLDPSETTGCVSDALCNDDNACTFDACGPDGNCSNTNLAAGTPCDDGNNCTINGACNGGGACNVTNLDTIPCGDPSPCAGYACGDTGFCECEQCLPVGPVQPEVPEMLKSRFLTVVPGNPGELTALQIVLANLPPPYDVYNGTELWVGPPKEVSENGSTADPIPGFSNFTAASLGCEPHVMDWGSVGELLIHHPTIIPGATYFIRATSNSCVVAGSPTYSDPLKLETGKWGDLVDDLTACPPGFPNGDVSILDVLAIIQRFASQECSVRKSRADLEPGTIDLTINISDVQAGINAFVGLPYSFEVPGGPPLCP